MASAAQILPLINPLQELQAAFCLFQLSGDVWIGDLREIAAIRNGTRSGEVQMYRLAAGRLLMRRYFETLSTSADPKKVIGDFMNSPSTKVFNAVAFSPLPTPPGTLNYWVGSPVQPMAGDWSTIKEFLFKVICGADQACFTYLIYFLAHMLQKPEEKPGVMIVLLGGQGVGKGTALSLLHEIYPRTTLQVSDIDHVIGRFNAAIERSYVVCMDEAMFAGDKKAMDRLKSMITEPQVTIEQKHQPRRTITSFHRFFAASNHKHFAHVDADDRRFVFLRVSDSRKGDFAYWDGLYSAIKDPAVIAAMVDALLKLDLSAFNVRERPKTVEHMEQKIRSLTGFDRYWFEVLQSGEFGFSTWIEGRFISTSRLMEGWQVHGKDGRTYAAPQEREIHEALRRLCPSAKGSRKKANGPQERGKLLPSLPDARAEFANAMGGEVTWAD